MTKKTKKNKSKVDKPTWSVSFLLATCGNYFLFALVVMLFLLSPSREVLYRESMIAFLAGFVSIFLVITTSKMSKFRVVIHEMKHAIVVLLTGNKLSKIVANNKDGFVEYQMYKDKLHFAPIIALAPYFFPLFSLPIFFISLIFENNSLVICSLILGISLSMDICFGIAEIHPHQTDFRSLVGGFLLSKLYLVGFYLFWPVFVIFWIHSGSSGLLRGLELLSILFLSKMS